MQKDDTKQKNKTKNDERKEREERANYTIKTRKFRFKTIHDKDKRENLISNSYFFSEMFTVI
jgi:hypothetical protein